MRTNYKSYYKDGIYFITFSIIENIPIFLNKTMFNILIQSFKFCRKAKDLKIIISYKKLILGMIIFILLSSYKCSENYKYKEFHNLLERANLILILPKEYSMTPIIQNKQVKYDIAYLQNNGIEVRYSIWPYDSQLVEYTAYLDRKAKGIKLIDSINGEYSEYMVDPNEMYKSFFQAFIFNICEKTDSSREEAKNLFGEFQYEHVFHDFNADYGAFTWCNLDKEFGQNYKACNVFMIHKKDCGMVVCFRLFEDWEHVKRNLKDEELAYNIYDMQFYRPVPPKSPHPKDIIRIYRQE